MTRRTPARRPARRPARAPVAVLLIAMLASVAAALGYQALAASSSPPPAVPSTTTTPPPVGLAPAAPPRALGRADGALPDGTTVWDEDVPGVANLSPALLAALRRAAADAAAAGVTFVVESGWRSPPYQEQLLRQAIAKYGSERAAARWVASPATSAHVSGDAVDIAPAGAREWLSEHGARYGLCRVYGNEPWHYELRAEAVERGCPSMYADAAHDPRTRP